MTRCSCCRRFLLSRALNPALLRGGLRCGVRDVDAFQFRRDHAAIALRQAPHQLAPGDGQLTGIFSQNRKKLDFNLNSSAHPLMREAPTRAGYLSR